MKNIIKKFMVSSIFLSAMAAESSNKTLIFLADYLNCQNQNSDNKKKY